jgi:hypothetical protein
MRLEQRPRVRVSGSAKSVSTAASSTISPALAHDGDAV